MIAPSKAFTARFRPLPWVKADNGNWIADVKPFRQEIRFMDEVVDMHTADGKCARDDQGKPIKRRFIVWISWPYGSDWFEHRDMGAGLHQTNHPYVTAATADECKALVQKIHNRQIGQFLERAA